ncbi:Tox-REase-5 domain-containing protein [Photorhabdus tasmaniensis]
MTNRAVIRLNDTTDHGGKIITAIDDWIYQSVPIVDWWKISKSGDRSITTQVEKHQEVCNTLNGVPNSHWHFMQPISYTYYFEKFSIYPNIKVFHTI